MEQDSEAVAVTVEEAQAAEAAVGSAEESFQPDGVGSSSATWER